MSALVRTVVFDQSLYAPTGMVHKWVAGVTEKFWMHAVDAAPARSGELKAGIGFDVDRIGPRLVNGIIYSNAPHTMFVVDGTTGPIMTNRRWAAGGIYADSFVMLWKDTPKGRRKIPIRKKGYWMKLRAHEQYTSGFADEVSGQQANNFFIKAWSRTARNHRAIRGVINPLG